MGSLLDLRNVTARYGPVQALRSEERRLARAVRPDQTDDLLLRQRQRDVVERYDAAEAPSEVFDG